MISNLVKVDDDIRSRRKPKQCVAALNHKSAPEWFELQGAINNHLEIRIIEKNIICICTVYLITLIDINDSLGQMTDNEDHHHPREEGYHGLVLPVHEEDGDDGNLIEDDYL